MSTSTTTEAPYVLRTDKDKVATLTLNRPKQYNALSMNMLEAILEQLESIEKENRIKVIVLAAAGKAFCPGHDLKEIRSNRNKDFGDALFAKCSEMMLKIRDIPQPVIARVQGIATAAGCQLVAACDLAIASEAARFATSGINYGIFCATPSVPLSRVLKPKKAFEMLFTGTFISASEAKEEGLINKVVAADQLDQAISEMANTIAHKAPDALKYAKSMFYEQLNMDLESAYQFASDKIVCNILEPDGAEGLDAFAEKRKPLWKR